MIVLLPKLKAGIVSDSLGQNIIGVLKNFHSPEELYGYEYANFKDTWLAGVYRDERVAFNALTESGIVPVDLNNFSDSKFLRYLNALLPVLNDPNTPKTYHSDRFVALYEELSVADKQLIENKDFGIISYLNLYEQAKRTFDLNLEFTTDNYFTLPQPGTAKTLYPKLHCMYLRNITSGTKILPYLNGNGNYSMDWLLQ